MLQALSSAESHPFNQHKLKLNTVQLPLYTDKQKKLTVLFS